MNRYPAQHTTHHRLVFDWKSWAWMRLCLLHLMVCGFSSAMAAEYPKAIHFRNIMQDQDIALGEVEAIFQDHEGFMWLGGRNALLRYDGYNFLGIRYAPDPQNLADTHAVTHVLELIEDSHRDLWAATRSGLYRYDRDRELMFPVTNEQGLPIFRETINALAESPDGTLLVGSDLGLSIYDTKRRVTTLLSHRPGDPESLPSNVVSEIYVDAKGMVWLGLNNGLLRIAWVGREMTLFVPDPANPSSVIHNEIRTITADHKGNIWGG